MGRGHVGPWLQVEREIALHSRLRHRNIVALHGHFADREHVYLVLEYCGRQVPQGLGGEGAPPRVFCAHGTAPPPGFAGLICGRPYVSPYLPVPARSAPGPSVFIIHTRAHLLFICGHGDHLAPLSPP